ncbi:MAG: hypothetical protein JXR23_02950 [Pontiellaceae bacterium]|nr:hypothetical protein [Pontiellaceae bacterium]
MKSAITVWQGRVAPVFDVSGTIVVFDSADVDSREELALPEGYPLNKLQFLQEHGIGVLICGAITRRTQEQAYALGISLYPFVSGSIEEVWAAQKEGTLMNASYSMPGCRRCRRRQGRCGKRNE